MFNSIGPSEQDTNTNTPNDIRIRYYHQINLFTQSRFERNWQRKQKTCISIINYRSNNKVFDKRRRQSKTMYYFVS